MKVTYSWIREFIDIKTGPQSLAEKFTMAGLSVASLEKIDGDWVYDIEVASNRPDLLSVRGIAREAAVVTGAKIKKSACGKWHMAKGRKTIRHKPCAISQFSIHIENKKDCGLYCGNLFTGVRVGPSAEPLKKRLRALGVRPVNNVVDITNYCLLEFGQPLHAFDFAKIGQGAIVVRRAKEGEQLVLIDGSQKKLQRGVLVIADSAKPLAVAGIMGGRDTEVSAQTTEVLLESACFDPVVVRRGSRLLGVSSDSSYRFERGVDLSTVKTALGRAAEMIRELCGGTLVAAEQSGTARMLKPKRISVSLKEATDVLGADIPLRKAIRVLKGLEFVVRKKTQDRLEIAVPTFRRDIKIPEDITEEIARSYGYDKIPLTTPEIKPFSMDTPAVATIKEKAKSLFVSMGLKEIVTYSLTCEEDYKKTFLAVPEGALSLENPLSQDYCLLRTTLVPALLACATFNANHNNADFEIFEIARIFDSESERLSLGIALSGSRRASWKKESRPYTLFDLKGILETLFQETGVLSYEINAAEENFCEANKGYRVIVQGSPVAAFGKVAEGVKRAWGIKSKEDIFVAEVGVDALARFARLKKVFKPVPATPLMTRDISVLTHQAVSFAAIKGLIERVAKRYLKGVSLVEQYRGQEIPEGSCGLTICVVYGSDEKTLTDAEINPLHQQVLDGLVRELSLTLR